MPLLMQSVAVVGVTGMNALAVFVFAMPALLAATRNLRVGLALAVLLVAAHVGFGYYPANAPPDARRTARLPSASCSRRSTCREKWDDSVARRDLPDHAWNSPRVRRRPASRRRS